MPEDGYDLTSFPADYLCLVYGGSSALFTEVSYPLMIAPTSALLVDVNLCGWFGVVAPIMISAVFCP